MPEQPAGQPGHGHHAPADPAAASLLDPHGELRAVVSDCVHCGFCLPSCPTYQLWGEEMDSPRGRIHLISQLLDGAVGSEAAALHIDRCLGCMACLTSCPSGVRYDRLIGAARSWRAAPAATGPQPAADHNATDHATDHPTATGPQPAADHNATDHATDHPTATRPQPAADHNATDHATDHPTATRPQPATDHNATDHATDHPTATATGRPLPPRSRRDRLIREAIFATFPYPGRLRLLTRPLRTAQRAGLDRLADRIGLVSRLAPELATALRVAPRMGTWSPAARRAAAIRLPGRIPAAGTRRAVVGMLTGCVQQVFFPRVNIATARVLSAEGCDVIIPAGQGCCGALSMHDGRRPEAARFARALIATFERAGVDAIVVNSAGCGSAMKEYQDLLAQDDQWADRAAALSAKVADVSEFLIALGPVAARHPLPLTAAYHDACHLGHAQRITAAPRDLLRAIPGLTLAELLDAGTCCGSAGIYNLVQPQAARQLGERKAAAVRQARADLLVSGNPGCALQIASALAAQQAPMPVAHLAEVLDASIRAIPASRLLHS